MWNIAKKGKKYSQLVRSEIKDINNLDVPFFYSKCDSKAVYNSDDRLLNNDFFIETGIDFVKERLSTLSKDDLDRQLFLM